MTKYGAFLQAVDRDAPAEWRGKFLRYKALKKALKECSSCASPRACYAGAAGPDRHQGQQTAEGDAAAAAGQAAAAAGGQQPAGSEAAEGSSGAPDAEVLFFELLKSELLRVNRCFVDTARALVARFQRTEMRRRFACGTAMQRLLGAGPSRYAALAERAYWCRKYARANAVALRKILKKYDKQKGGQRGRAFLQHCWRMPAGGAFLHSPLLDELKAIQDVLQEQRIQPEDVQLCEVANTAAKPGSEVVAAATAAAGVPAQLPAGASSAAAAGLDGPHVMLSSSDLEWGGEDGGAGVDQVPELRCRTHPAAADDDSMGQMPSTALSFAVSSTTFASLAFAGEGSMLARGTTVASGTAAGPGVVAGSVSTTASAAGVSAGQRPALSRFKDEELNCPICLELLFKPVGLACGHKFCKQCALEHASLGKAVGTFANLCSYVPASVTCPQCRQSGVYKGAVRLRQLEKVLKTRHAGEWAERQAEERQRERELMEAAAAQQRASAGSWWSNTINARDALLGL